MVEFHSSVYSCPIFPAPFIEDTVFSSTGCFFLLCRRLVDYRVEGPFLGSLFCSIDLCVCFCANTILSWWLRLCNRAWVQNCDAPSFGFPFQHSSGYSGSFLVQTNFQFICSSSVKTVDGILIGVALNVWIALGSIGILIIFVLPICEHFFFVSCSIS